MNILNPGERKSILEQLALAPDEVLVAAYNHWHQIRDGVIQARARLQGEATPAPSAPSKPTLVKLSAAVADEEEAPAETSVERPNVSPGEPAITKIGSETKSYLINALHEDLPISMGKYEEHLKLLWKRGEVKFDGRNYYL